jgi:hypothetical protein
VLWQHTRSRCLSLSVAHLVALLHQLAGEVDADEACATWWLKAVRRSGSQEDLPPGRMRSQACVLKCAVRVPIMRIFLGGTLDAAAVTSAARQLRRGTAGTTTESLLLPEAPRSWWLNLAA